MGKLGVCLVLKPGVNSIKRFLTAVTAMYFAIISLVFYTTKKISEELIYYYSLRLKEKIGE